MLGHYAYLVRALDQLVEQVVLYLGRVPFRMEAFYSSPSIDFRFKIINLRELDAALLPSSEDWADNALSILAKCDPFQSIQTILPRLWWFEGDKQNLALSTLVMLSGLIAIAESGNERTEEVGMINVLENKVLGPMVLEKVEEEREQIREPAYEQGLSQGLSYGFRQGLSQGQQQILRTVPIEKFGTIPNWAAHRLENGCSV